MARTHEAIGVIRRLPALVAIIVLAALLLSPVSAFAQASAAPTPANSAASQSQAPASPNQGTATSPNPQQAPGTVQSTVPSAAPSAAGSAQPSAGESAPASASASASPATRAAPTPVGGNAPTTQQEPLSYLAYLLIVLAVIWFIAALVGIVRLLIRPPAGQAAFIPDPEKDRPFLSFIMPFAALVTVGVIVTIWGVLFLWVSHYSEIGVLAIDLFVVCFVMLIATILALRASRQAPTGVH